MLSFGAAELREFLQVNARAFWAIGQNPVQLRGRLPTERHRLLQRRQLRQVGVRRLANVHEAGTGFWTNCPNARAFTCKNSRNSAARSSACIGGPPGRNDILVSHVAALL